MTWMAWMNWTELGLDELDNLAWVDWTELGLFN